MGAGTASPGPVDPALQAALTQHIMAKVVAAKQQEVQELVAGVASKYGLAADYGRVEDTIKAVWAEEVGNAASIAWLAAPTCCWIFRCFTRMGQRTSSGTWPAIPPCRQPMARWVLLKSPIAGPAGRMPCRVACPAGSHALP